jgi:CheY-like chemotaxis protein
MSKSNKVAPLKVILVEHDPDPERALEKSIASARVPSVVERASGLRELIARLSGEGPFANRQDYPLPSLILIDLKLSDGSALDLLTWLAKHSLKPRIPVVILTSSRERLDLARARKLGLHSSLVKPVQAEELSLVLEAVQLYWKSPRSKA